MQYIDGITIERSNKPLTIHGEINMQNQLPPNHIYKYSTWSPLPITIENARPPAEGLTLANLLFSTCIATQCHSSLVHNR